MKPADQPAVPDRISDATNRFTKTRRDHSSEIAEDYVELIAQLIDRDGAARTVEIARALGVSHVTVNRTVQRLQTLGLVETAPYAAIDLTEAGRKLARECAARHELVVAFLCTLGVNALDAERDAEGIEHHLSAATLAAMRAFVAERSGRS